MELANRPGPVTGEAGDPGPHVTDRSNPRGTEENRASCDDPVDGGPHPDHSTWTAPDAMADGVPDQRLNTRRIGPVVRATVRGLEVSA